MILEPNPLASLPQYSDEELAEFNREFERLPASKIIQWGVDNFAPHLCLSASMTDAINIGCVLMGAAGEYSTRFGFRSTRFP